VTVVRGADCAAYAFVSCRCILAALCSVGAVLSVPEGWSGYLYPMAHARVVFMDHTALFPCSRLARLAISLLTSYLWQPFTEANLLLTKSGKLRRRAIATLYASRLAALFAEVEGRAPPEAASLAPGWPRSQAQKAGDTEEQAAEASPGTAESVRKPRRCGWSMWHARAMGDWQELAKTFLGICLEVQ